MTSRISRSHGDEEECSRDLEIHWSKREAFSALPPGGHGRNDDDFRARGRDNEFGPWDDVQVPMGAEVKGHATSDAFHSASPRSRAPVCAQATGERVDLGEGQGGKDGDNKRSRIMRKWSFQEDERRSIRDCKISFPSSTAVLPPTLNPLPSDHKGSENGGKGGGSGTPEGDGDRDRPRQHVSRAATIGADHSYGGEWLVGWVADVYVYLLCARFMLVFVQSLRG